MRFSSSFKVGILTVSAIVILLFTVMWIKGRTISAGERITVKFQDVNGMRAGSGVQMMGYRIGQIEEIIPVVDGEKSYVEIKFVITEQGVEIPTASSISIQQSGIIGEQFLEITPPRIKFIYLPVRNKSEILHTQDKVQMELSEKNYDVGEVRSLEIINTDTLILNEREEIKTEYAYKIGYVINLPGLIIPERIDGKIITYEDKNKLMIKPKNDVKMIYPETDLKYTIIEPLRIADFLNIQYRSAASLAETNEKIGAILTDDVINDLKLTAGNMNVLTQNANVTFEKAQLLIDTSQMELQQLISITNSTSEKLIKLVDNVNAIIGDKEFKNTMYTTAKSIDSLAKDINVIVADEKTKETLSNLAITSKNIADISTSINMMTKDEKLKINVKETISKLNVAIDETTTMVKHINAIAFEDKESVQTIIENANETSKNLKKFSEKLNKRFLLFRLLF